MPWLTTGFFSSVATNSVSPADSALFRSSAGFCDMLVSFSLMELSSKLSGLVRPRDRTGVRLEEDAQRQLRLHLPVAIVDLLKIHVGDARDARQLFELQQVRVEPVEVAAQAHLDRLLAVVGAALALERLDGLGLQRVLLGHLPDLLEDLVHFLLLRQLALEESDRLLKLVDLAIDVVDAGGLALQVAELLLAAANLGQPFSLALVAL